MNEDCRVIHGEAMEAMRAMPAGAFDAVVTDPPYFRVADEAWDKQWDSTDAYLGWLGEIADEWRRVLKPSGSLYVFASPRMAARVELLVGERFNVLNAITWQKDFPCGALKYGAENFRSFVEMSERIVFAEQDNPGGKLIRRHREAASMTCKEVASLAGAFGNVNRGGSVSNWELGLNLPIRTHWEAISETLGLPDYDEFVTEFVRPFFAREDRPHTDVWTFKPVKMARLIHPCEKPVPLLRHILNTSTREGDTVLDCFAGSGSLGEACIKTGRRAVLIESDARYIPIIERRLAGAATPLFDGLPA